MRMCLLLSLARLIQNMYPMTDIALVQNEGQRSKVILCKNWSSGLGGVKIAHCPKVLILAPVFSQQVWRGIPIYRLWLLMEAPYNMPFPTLAFFESLIFSPTVVIFLYFL